MVRMTVSQVPHLRRIRLMKSRKIAYLSSLMAGACFADASFVNFRSKSISSLSRGVLSHPLIAPNNRPTYSFQTNTCTHQPPASREICNIGLYGSNLNNNEDSKEEKLDAERALGVLVLLTVPLAWGTFAPVVRYVYEIQPPVPGFVFSAGYYLVASFTLLGLLAANQDDQEEMIVMDAEKDSEEMKMIPIQGGVELGSYLFLGNCLQVIGLKTVPADRAAFLVQLTTIMVPLVSAFLAGDLMAIPVRTWIACVVAFAGVLVMGFDGQDNTIELDPSYILPSISSVVHAFSGGDFLIVLAAFAYTMHVVRLGRYAQFTTPLKLAASKATVEATFSVVLVFGLVLFGNGVGTTDLSGIMSYANEMGTEISTFFSTLQEGISSGSIPNSVLLSAGGACIWTGLVTCAYTIYAQSFGQRRVNPTDANLIYSTQPLFSALFAWGLLGETLGTTGYLGGGLIASALWLITSGDDESIDSKTT